MWWLVANLVSFGISKIGSSGLARLIAGGAGIGAAVDVLNIDLLRQEAIKIAPGSDPEAIEEAARTTMRLLGLAGDDVLWPRQRDGQPIVPQYFTLDLTRGRAWFSARHYSRKSVRAGARRSGGRSYGRGVRNAQSAVMAARS